MAAGLCEYIMQQQEAARGCVISSVARTLCLQSCRRQSPLCRGCAGTRQVQAARRQHGAVQGGQSDRGKQGYALAALTHASFDV